MDVTTDTGRSIRPAAWPWVSLVARLGLSAVWLVAGAAKAGDLAASGRAVNAYKVMPYDAARLVGAMLPLVEIGLGVLLLVGLAVRLTAGISAGLLVVFIAGIVWAWSQGLAIDCGCFGSGGQLAAGQGPTYGTEILRDLGFLALAAVPLWRPRSRFSIDGALMGETAMGARR